MSMLKSLEKLKSGFTGGIYKWAIETAKQLRMQRPPTKECARDVSTGRSKKLTEDNISFTAIGTASGLLLWPGIVGKE